MAFYPCDNIPSGSGSSSGVTVEEGVLTSGGSYPSLVLSEIPDVAIFYRNDPNLTPSIGYCIWEKAKSKLYNGTYSGGILGCDFISSSDRSKFILTEFANTQYVPTFGVYQGSSSNTSLTFKSNDRTNWNYILLYF